MKQFLGICCFLLLLVGSGQLPAQELVITKKGDVFLCETAEVNKDLLTYSFSYLDQVFHDTIHVDRLAYHGKNFIYEGRNEPDGKYSTDLIVPKDGEPLICKILSLASGNIEYAFLIGNNEGRNRISKKNVAYFSRSYRKKTDLQKESNDYFSSLEFTRALVMIREPDQMSDSLNASRDLVITLSGDQFACAIDEIGADRIHYSFYANKMVNKNSIDKRDVSHVIRDHRGGSPVEISIAPKTSQMSRDLIITKEGSVVPCFIDHVGPNTISYYVEEEGEPAFKIAAEGTLLYHGENFLDKLEGRDELRTSIYQDFILTKNGSILLCEIESRSTTHVRYSFKMNKMKMQNSIAKIDIIYQGLNFLRQEQESLAEEKKEEVNEEAVSAVVPVESPEEVADRQAPEVLIISPALDGESSFEAVAHDLSTLQISGVVMDNSRINELIVNGRRVEAGEHGKFNIDVELESGANSILIQASDIHNNQRSLTYTIERKAFVPKEEVVAARDADPPQIKILSPEMDPDLAQSYVTNTQKSATVSGNVSDLSGVYEVLINGKDAILSANGDFSGKVLLRVGENPVSIQATDLESNVASLSFTITREDVATLSDQPDLLGSNDRYYALIIGISDYTDPMIPSLDEHPTRDAERLSKLLTNMYHFQEENMTLLLDPNRTDILKTFDLLSREITGNDNLLIFFAGHGYYDPDTRLGYWLPSDAESDFTANWIYNDVLVANLKRIHSKHTLLISDACFSGSIFKTRSLSAAPVAYQKKYEMRSRKAITSGVVEAVPNESVFFKYLMAKLASNQNKYMSAGELFRNLEFPVSNNSPNSPQYGTIQNVDDEGGDFIFIRK